MHIAMPTLAFDTFTLSSIFRRTIFGCCGLALVALGLLSMASVDRLAAERLNGGCRAAGRLASFEAPGSISWGCKIVIRGGRASKRHPKRSLAHLRRSIAHVDKKRATISSYEARLRSCGQVVHRESRLLAPCRTGGAHLYFGDRRLCDLEETSSGDMWPRGSQFGRFQFVCYSPSSSSSPLAAAAVKSQL